MLYGHRGTVVTPLFDEGHRGASVASRSDHCG